MKPKTDLSIEELKRYEAAHHRWSYKGIPGQKNPFDLAIYESLLWDLKPDLIIEIGTKHGASALWLADRVNRVGFDTEIHSIDVIRSADVGTSDRYGYNKLVFYYDGWQGYEYEGKFPDHWSEDLNILLIDDGSHHAPEVLGALEKFAPYCSYMIVEDCHIDLLDLPTFREMGGPWKGVQAFLGSEAGQDWEIDRERCDTFGHNVTFCMDGYLKRK